MASLSDTPVALDTAYRERFVTLQRLKIPRLSRGIAWLIVLGLLLGAALLYFTPWIQTAGGYGKLVELSPSGRPQRVTALVTGRIKKWYVRDGDGVKQFAMRGLSSPGKRDGLYWASLPGEPVSPAGPAFADAKPGQPYHGYVYKILTAQGKDAPGGAKSYVKNGKMTEGYALIAWPAKYGDTGIMTFIVNQDGVVYQKNLGPGTATLARATTAYNPDSSWSKAGAAK